MNEFELIERLTAGLHHNSQVRTGAGDDCAVLDVGVPGRALLFKTDAVVEGVHFDREADAERVGRKALARCLSDVAAMAGRPLHAVVTLGLPADFDPGYLASLYAGMNALAAEHDVAIVGGETTNNRDHLLVNIALIGDVPEGGAVLRSGARAGDALFVSGELGGSLAGRHLDFEPRLREAEWLRENADLGGMIDVSDGLAGDLRHLAQASGVGVEILESAIPVSRAAKLRYRGNETTKPPLLAALTDGEDFELLFSVPGSQAVAVLDGWRQAFPDTRLTCIGKVLEGGEIRIRGDHGMRDLTESGFAHFSPN